MSEEIDLNINHLCTTEDAFEQFQATSMYEEDEFITLSDIVSPPPQAPDLSADLLDIPYENEVVLETQLDEQVPEVNSTIEIGLEDTKQPEFFSPLSTEHNPEVHAEIALESKPKRGRRKNTQQSESILTVNQNHNEQSNNKQGISAPDSIPTKSTPPAYKKRSRKPKRNGKTSARRKINGQTSLDDTAQVSDNTELQSGSLLSSTPISNSVSESENASVGKKPIRRKGAKSKKKQDKNIDTPKGKDTEIMEIEIHASDSKSNDISLTDNTLNTITPKRGRRKRKDFSEKSTHQEQEPVTTFSKMSLDQSQTEEIVSASDEVPVKSPKKQKRSKKTHQEVTTKDQTDITTTESGENDDFNDDICLSQLKETLEPTDTFHDAMEVCESMEVSLEEVVTTKAPIVESNANSMLPTVAELNTEHVKVEQGMGTDQQQFEDVKNEIKQEEYRNNVNESNEDFNDSLLIEDTSKRPTRSKARKTFHYDEGSDEDPFANVESSDEEPKRGKKGKKYYSDDEYVPGANKRDNISSSDVSDSDIDAAVDELVMSQRRKKQRLDTSLDSSPRKRGRKPKLEREVDGNSSLEVKTITPDESHTQDDDIEICLQSSLIKADEDSKQKLGWGASKEFENFIAKRIQGTDIKIKKVSSVQPLEIPVIDPNDAKKTVETSMQTTQITTSSVEVQTSAPYDVPMKDNVSLTSKQAENACEFLKGIVKTTADLGELMTQKSEDFIKKKINTTHITDTLKMDYCVRKSFLLFKLAKHNLMQMEEDLSKQYEEFLTKNDLLKHRETPKVLTPVKKSDDGDSDCEIIDAPTTVVQKPKKDVKPKFNPKTVFLNKELSIKIAKKPSEEKKEQKLQIKGRHTVWISDSVMVKKVKPTQSFLAQDSRNKKPPDYVTIEMVNNFFKEYEHQQALSTCAPFVTTEWLYSNKMYVCSYSFTKTDDFSPATITEMPSGSELNTSPDTRVAIVGNKHCQQSNIENKEYSPRSLFSLCTQALQNYMNISISKPCGETEIQNVISLNTIKSPKTLYSICVNYLQGFLNDGQIQENFENIDIINVVPLQTLCFQKVIEIMGYSDDIETTLEINTMAQQKLDVELVTSQLNYQHDIPYHDVKTLFSLCVIFIQNQLYPKKDTKTKLVCDKFHPNKSINTPNTLKNITIKVVTNLMNSENESNEKVEVTKSLFDLCFQTITNNFGETQEEAQEHAPKECLTINSINRLTEEAYFNMEESTNFTDNPEYYADNDDDTNFYEDEAEEHDFDETSNTEDSNWNSQVDVKEFISIPNNLKESFKPTAERNVLLPVAEEVAVTRIKIEPEEEHEQIVDSSLVKTEPLHNFDEMTIIPESIMTNSVSPENDFSSGKVQRKGSASYDVDSFETFVRTNKMMLDLNEGAEIFSQSAARVRRQYEPDSDPENDMGMSLLVPQTFEPLFIENAKDSLMESSGDENSSKKPAGKKKTDRRKVKGKKVDMTKSDKQVSLEKVSTKEIPKEKQPVCNEIAVLTRRMRGKIRQEEKKVESSDSEHENGSIISKKDKESDNILARKGKENTKDKESDNILSKKGKENTNNKTKQKIDKIVEDEIQCNNVDSTEQLNEQNKCDSPDPSTHSFTGFSAIDQNEGYNYQKYVKYVYDKILTSESDEGKSKPGKTSPLFNPDEPVELLECEPTMPIFDNQDTTTKPADITSDKEIAIKERPVPAEKETGKEPLPYETRHGWKCYQLDTNDPKLYSDAQIVLEKLPETFVDTYFKYQNISNSNKEDEEVNRLINLQSLNRPAVKEGRGRGRSKRHPPKDQATAKTGLEEDNTDSRVDSPTFSEPYDELTPSEDEDAKVDDESAPPTKKENSSENTMAKSSLMDDNDTDEETGVKIKKEIPDAGANDQPVKKYKPGPKSKCKPPELGDSESFMLTADKMMNRELNLLHAPIVPVDQIQETSSKGPVTRNKQKNTSKSGATSKRMTAEDDGSSSEEEKHQWFTIKEKLLKKMINKKDTTREDDAKRAKLVSEFIERRGDLAENYLAKRRKGGRSKRSLKKMLERQKQFKVLSRELFGDVPDTSHQGKGKHSSYFKGRRNIRKVLDKKCLAKSTVLANMEEFERKRRINIRQSRLRDILGCEEGVNVLVINDEVCLEYDFESNRPVVTIHQFFTKVMKAHQYEGVKFMWDACFESLEHIEAGHPGGGCILAHCMGLGKTLQVLALLHTVLTHPRVGMQRVLVCCPLSTVLNWVDEIHKWIGPVTDQIKVFELSKLRKTNVRAYQLEDWYKGGGIFIIGYELFRSLTTLDPYLDDVRPVIVNKIRSALLDPGPDIIICDEGHLLKNDCSVLAVAMSRVRTKRRIVLTGTPMQNNLREYYCMVNFVKPNLLGTYAEYSNRFENPIMNGQHRDSIEEDIRLMKARTHILHKVLEGCLQRQEASVLYPYLPKKHEYTVFVSLSKCQWDLYKHYLQNCTNEVRSNKNNVLKDFHILQKIWSHPQVLHNFQSRSADAKNKLKIEKLEDDLATEDLNAEDIKPSDTDTWWLQYLDGGEMLDSLHSSNKFVCVFRILEECIALGDKLLIFSTSLFSMDALEYFLKKIKSWSLGKEYYRLDGSVPAEVRQKWCREFNADHNVNTKLFLISTRAGCLGLNMTAANRVIILDTSWNPAHDIQSIFRVYRFGQKKDCYIYRLVALGTMEQKIYERSVTKQAVACRVVDEQQIDRHYNMADLTELYKYDEAGVGVAGGVAVGVEDVVLLRVARDINLHAVHEHDSLLRGEHEQHLPEHERNAAWMQFQMEHAHKQEDLVPAPVPCLTLTNKKVHSHDYTKGVTAKSTIVKAEREEDAAFKPKPDKKRGTKKNTVVTCSIPIESLSAGNSNKPLEQDREEELVSKITHILIKHNFHIRQEPREIADLVSNVRRIVASGQLENINETDELSVSIANLLLQNDLPMRQLTNIVCESVNNTIVESTASSSKEEPKKVKGRSGRVKGRKGYVYEEVKPVEKEVEVEYDARTRRRAALEAERSFDTINDAVFDVGDDSDAEFVPDADVHLEIGNEPEENDAMDMDNDITDMENDTGDTENDRVQNVEEEPKPHTKRKSYETPKANEVKKKDTIRIRNDVFDRQTKKLHEEMNSILLSDDDEPPPKKRPGPARRTMKSNTLEEKVQETVEPTKAQNENVQETVESTKTHKEKVQDPGESKINVKSEEDKIPLHPSLLSNQNFIKIVAHTYLTGNPMLDEDAATLAAQYSTQKALNEFDSTGKEIKSGPLYDIAVQVLGIDILKKLHHTKGKTAVKSAQPTPEKTTETTKETSPEPAKPGPKLKTIKLKIRRPVEGSISAMPSSMTSTVVSSSSFAPLTVSSSSFAPLVVSSSSFAPLVVSSPSMAPSSLIATPTVPAQLPVLTPALNANVVPVGFYRLGARPSSAPWTHLNINSCFDRSNGFSYSYDSFKGAAEIPTNNTHRSADECILPDDDDIHIVSDPVIPQPAPTAQPLRLRQIAPATIPGLTHILPRKSVPLDLSNVTSGKSVLTPMDTNSPVQNNMTPTHNIRTIPNILSKRNNLLSSAANATPPVAQLTIDPNTITLDSDDEDCLPSVNFSGTSSAAPVVPVSLTAANTHSTLDLSALSYGLGCTSMVHIGVPPTSAGNHQPIILNSQLGSAPKAANVKVVDTKYVVIPSSNIKFSKRADLPAGAVPVAMSRVHQSAANETVEILNDDAESILPVSTLESEANFKKLCKPGDVLRISKSGKIEILNRKDQHQPVLPANNMSSTALSSGPTPVNISTTALSNKHTPANISTKAPSNKPTPVNISTTALSHKHTPANISTMAPSNKPTPVTIEIDDAPIVSSKAGLKPHPKPQQPTRFLRGSTIETKQKETPAKNSTPAKSTPLKSSTPAKSTPLILKSSTPAKSTPLKSSTPARSTPLKSSTPARSNVPRTHRPNSPPDPLSILKDVIHIEADDYDLEQKSNANVTIKKATAKNVTNTNKAKPESLLINSIAKNKTTAVKLTDSAWHKKFTNKDKAATEPQSKPITTQSILNNFKTSGIKVSMTALAQKQEQKSNVVAPSQPNRKTKTVSASDSKKDKRATDTVIDITSMDDAPPPSTDRNKGKLKLGSTIVGTSKDIILCGAGKAIKRPQAATVSTFEAKRASTSTESASAKKKKTDKPLTLKDFDIDDIDDIIELD